MKPVQLSVSKLHPHRRAPLSCDYRNRRGEARMFAFQGAYHSEAIAGFLPNAFRRSWPRRRSMPLKCEGNCPPGRRLSFSLRSVRTGGGSGSVSSSTASKGVHSSSTGVGGGASAARSFHTMRKPAGAAVHSSSASTRSALHRAQELKLCAALRMILAEAECPTRAQTMLNSSPPSRGKFCRSVALAEDGKERVNQDLA